MRDADIPAPRLIAPTLPIEETARLGDEIYERDIRRRVEADHHGEVVAIDVDSGDYAIAEPPLPQPTPCENAVLPLIFG